MPNEPNEQNAKRYKIEFIVIIALMIIVGIFILLFIAKA